MIVLTIEFLWWNQAPDCVTRNVEARIVNIGKAAHLPMITLKGQSFLLCDIHRGRVFRHNLTPDVNGLPVILPCVGGEMKRAYHSYAADSILFVEALYRIIEDADKSNKVLRDVE